MVTTPGGKLRWQTALAGTVPCSLASIVGLQLDILCGCASSSRRSTTRCAPSSRHNTCSSSRRQGERDQMAKWAEKKGDAGLQAYMRDKNAQSLDGLPGLRFPGT